MSAQLVQKEQEKKQLEIKMDEVQKEKSSLESKLEEDRSNFENEMQKTIDKQKQSEVGMSCHRPTDILEVSTIGRPLRIGILSFHPHARVPH